MKFTPLVTRAYTWVEYELQCRPRLPLSVPILQVGRDFAAMLGQCRAMMASLAVPARQASLRRLRGRYCRCAVCRSCHHREQSEKWSAEAPASALIIYRVPFYRDNVRSRHAPRQSTELAGIRQWLLLPPCTAASSWSFRHSLRPHWNDQRRYKAVERCPR
jgi:hypothetical protein